jgi:transcriptional regulator with XRE-family HTH domain
MEMFDKKKVCKSYIYANKTMKKLRNKNGLSVRGLAARVGLSPAYINLIETGQRSVTAETAQKIEKCLKRELP